MKTYNRSQENMRHNLNDVRSKVLRLPNVVAVGIGLKESNGKFTDEIAYRIFVTEKKDVSELKSDEVVPSTINNNKTDVLTPLKITDDADVCGTERRTLKKHRPLQAGIAISTDSDSYGTLGWFATLDADDTPLILSNKHVLYDATNTTDNRKLNTAQPQVGEKSKCCCCECGSDNVIGETLIGIRDISPASDTSVDSGIAKINPDFADDIKFLITNDSTDETLEVTGTAEAVVGETVRKIGARSAFTTGVVVHLGDVAVEEATDPDGNDIDVRQGQILIVPADTETYELRKGDCKKAFSNSGDSGAVILNDSNEIIALNWGSDKDTHSIVITIANHIENVLTKLSDNGFPITLAVTPDGGGDADTIKKSKFVDNDNLNVLKQLRDANLNSLLKEIFEKHNQEVLELINNNRQVTVAWQRNQGPAFTAAVARSAKRPHYKIPFEINGITRKTLLQQMAQVLMKNGSLKLKDAIIAYQPAIQKVFNNGETIRDFAIDLKNFGFLDSIEPITKQIPEQNWQKHKDILEPLKQ